MVSQADLINDCLELVAEKSEDIAPEVYRRFFGLYPQAEELFGIDTADVVKGGMIISLLQEMMNFSEGLIYTENVRRWVNDHRGYGVTQPMYEDMFGCLLATMQSVIGSEWSTEMNDAWLAQFEKLKDFIATTYAYK